MAINSDLNEPPTRGQPPKRGQKLGSQSVLYSDVPLYLVPCNYMYDFTLLFFLFSSSTPV